MNRLPAESSFPVNYPSSPVWNAISNLMEQPNNKFAGAIRDIYGRLGPKYLQDIAEGGPPEINEFMKLLPAGGAVVDIGCAGGRDSQIFSDSGFKVTGLDITEAFLEEARRRA